MAEEGRDADQGADNQCDADQQLAGGHERREPGLVAAIEQSLDKVTIPIVGDRRPALLRQRHGALPIGRELPAGHPLEVDNLVPTRPATTCSRGIHTH